MKVLFKALLLLTFSLFNTYAQISEYTFVPIFPNYPIAKNNVLGIGNLGFDSKEAFYNPSYTSDSQYGLSIFISNNTQIYSNSKIKEYAGEVDKFKSKFITVPNISLQYNFGNYIIYLQYFNDLLLYNYAPSGTWIKEFYTFNGLYGLSVKEPEFLINNHLVQFAISMKIIKNLSASIALLSNIYQNKSVFGTFTEELNSEFLDNYQVLTAINYSANPISLYLLFKSQTDPQRLGTEIMKVDNEIKYYNNSLVSYPGNLGYGIQYCIYEPLKLSLEMQHEFLNVNYKYEYKKAPSEVSDFSGEISHKIFNNKINLGVNYLTPIDLSIGFLYSTYLKYDVDVNKTIKYLHALSKIDNSTFYVLTFEYRYYNWLLNLGYQFSEANYDNERFDGNLSRKDIYQSLKLGVGYVFR